MGVVKDQPDALGIKTISQVEEAHAALEGVEETDALTLVYYRGIDLVRRVDVVADRVGCGLCEVPGGAVVGAGDVDLREEC